MMGTFVLSRDGYDEFFVQAQKVRRLVMQDFDRAFEFCDVSFLFLWGSFKIFDLNKVLIVPTVPTGPKKS
jgi:Asp-tRNA(Asn)/Glu-tRNA(Gln) amidotransferase A subunit family amidase